MRRTDRILTHKEMEDLEFRWCDILLVASNSKWSIRVAYRWINGVPTVFPGLSEGAKVGGEAISRQGHLRLYRLFEAQFLRAIYDQVMTDEIN
jgi:hypothetical protein